MAWRNVCICVVVLFIFVCDLISFCLGVAAEQQRTTAFVDYDKVGEYYFCNYSSYVASGYGAGAFVTLLLGHLVLMGVTRCFCCAKGELRGGLKCCAICSFIFLWLSWFIASVCFLAGANGNSIHTKTESIDVNNYPLSCETMRKGVFAAAASFTVFDFILAEVYYLILACNQPQSSHGVNTGWQGHPTPAFPPQQSPYAL